MSPVRRAINVAGMALGCAYALGFAYWALSGTVSFYETARGATTEAAEPTAEISKPAGSDDPWDPHCRQSILSQLREPSSATIVYEGINKPTPTSHKRIGAEDDARLYRVRARNGFGGMNAERWSCERIHGTYIVLARG